MLSQKFPNRIVRKGRFAYEAWVLHPADVWFLVGTFWFEWYARLELKAFLRRINNGP